MTNRAKRALSLLLVPAKEGDGTPVVAEEFFDQMEIYPGKYVFSLRSVSRDNNVG